jgi:hypothetical protein
MPKMTLLLLLAVALLGCQPIRPPAAPAAPNTAGEAPAPAASPTTTPEETMTIENPLVGQAIADLATRLTIAATEIKVVSVEEVTWPDTSLGCPQPGMAYAQVLRDGVRIILSAGDVQYHYHSSTEGPPFLCENPPTQ